MSQGPKSEPPQTTPQNPSVKPRDLCGERVSPTSEVQCPRSEPWLPASKLPKLPARYSNSSLISFVRNILVTNPLFPKFYADVVLSSAPNSREAKILRPQYKKILEKVNEAINTMSPTKTCTHIKVTGVRCGSPALYGERFCYFHQNAHRGVRKPPQSRLHPIAILEDEESIQSSLMEVINALMRNTIDLKRAELILRALHIAVKNSRRAKFGNSHDMVREVPEYSFPQEETHVEKEMNVGTAALGCPGGEAAASTQPAAAAWVEPGEPGAEDELPAVSAMKPRPVVEEDPELWERMERGGQILKRQEAERKAQAREGIAAEATTGHVGTAALGCPSGPEVPVRSALPSTSTTSVPAHDFKKQTQSTNAQAAPAASQSVEESKAAIASAAERRVPEQKLAIASAAETCVPEQKSAIAGAAETCVLEGRPKVAQRFSAGNEAVTTTRAVGTPDPRPQTPTPPRKPAQTAPAPKKRKNAAHRASGG